MSTARQLTIELPEETVQDWDDATMAAEIRVLWILRQVGRHVISTGRGAELAGIPYADFLYMMSEHNVSPIEFTDAELDAELRAL